ncbi:MAG: hypothetical protein NC201_01350 [Prevotella sp.]|nr:hypothetical protein [Bacteroides sp.]MCM1365873.1 hypothetical protein [Prevotella sp.]
MSRKIGKQPTSLKLYWRQFLTLCLFILCSFAISAQQRNDAQQVKSITGTDSIAKVEADASGHKLRESIFPVGSRSLAFSHFTWGAEIGSSIDMSGNDMSTFDIDVIVGYKNNFIRTLGMGVGVHRAFGNTSTFIPLYAVFRSSFRTRPSIAFVNLKLGYSFNTVKDTDTSSGTKMSLGVGFNLAMSKRFQSHLIIGGEYFRLDNNQALAAGLRVRDLFLAQISFGMNF